MLRKFYISGLALMVVAGLAAQTALAETPNQILSSIESEAKATPGFQGFSAARGESFFKATSSKKLSCASCHTENPAAQCGKVQRSGQGCKVVQAQLQ